MTEISSAAAACHGTVNRFRSVGIPHLKTTISVFEPGTDRELKYGETGEVCMTAPTVMLGYYGQPDETNQVLRLHRDGRKWIHSGDIGHMDEDGFLFIDGRTKRMIIRHDGFKVFPSLIEDVVSRHPAVSQCCTIGIKDVHHNQGQLPAVYVQLKIDRKNQQSVIQQELTELCERGLPEYAQPSAWIFIDKMPMTAISKIDYRALEKLTKES